jgi:hypothetical protein
VCCREHGVQLERALKDLAGCGLKRSASVGYLSSYILLVTHDISKDSKLADVIILELSR